MKAAFLRLAGQPPAVPVGGEKAKASIRRKRPPLVKWKRVTPPYENQRRSSPNGRTKLITHEMKMAISHSDRAEVSKESDLWEVEAGYKGDIEETM